MFRKKDHLVGLDIGSRTIKVCEVDDIRKGLRLRKLGMIDLAPGAIEEGVIQDPDEVAGTISELFRHQNIKEKNVAISVGGYSVIVKKVNIQSMSEDELQETITQEAEQYIPFDISDVNLDFQILGENESNPNQMSVLLVAVKKDLLDEYIDMLDIAGLTPCVVDVDAFALQNIYETNYDTAGKTVALIDIGESKTSLNIVKGIHSTFIRDVSLGCGQITERIAEQFGISFEEAIPVKEGEFTDDITEWDLQKIQSQVIEGWAAEISRALEFFFQSFGDDPIDRILLSGGGANLEAFRDLLAGETSTEVAVINPFDRFTVDSAGLTQDLIRQIAPQAAICMGLAIRRIDDK